MAKFSDIPQFTRDGNYRVNMPMDHLQEQVRRYTEEYGCDLDPDFQRGHVWTETQQIRYVEFRLRGGKSGRDILFNHPNWMGSFEGNMVLVDGKQRLEAVRRFLENEIPAFGVFYNDYEDKWRLGNFDFIIVVNNLKTRREVLQWYVDLNAGGTPHTDDEINKVHALMEKEPDPAASAPRLVSPRTEPSKPLKKGG